MHIKNGFEIKTICGENIVLASGQENIDFSKMITLNETALCVWNAVIGKEFTVSDMVEAVMAEYEVGIELATKDCEALATELKNVGIVE